MTGFNQRSYYHFRRELSSALTVAKTGCSLETKGAGRVQWEGALVESRKRNDQKWRFVSVIRLSCFISHISGE